MNPVTVIRSWSQRWLALLNHHLQPRAQLVPARISRRINLRSNRAARIARLRDHTRLL